MSIQLISMIIQALPSRDLKYVIIETLNNVDFTPASLPTTTSVFQNIYERLKSFKLCSLSKIFEALATIYVAAGWLHVEDGGICGPDPRKCQLWQPLFRDQRARASQKRVTKVKIYVISAFCGWGTNIDQFDRICGLRKVGGSLDMWQWGGCGGGYVVRGHLR